MDSAIQLTLMIAVMVLLLVLGEWIAVALGLAGVAIIVVFMGIDRLSVLGDIATNTVTSFELTALPMFVLMGAFITNSRLANQFYDGIDVWLRPVPGGLLHTNIIASTIFGAISGSSVATAATIGTSSLPRLRAGNYNRRLATGSLAAGGTLGILLPPSALMIVYGATTGTSVADLFMAGIIPGIIIAAGFGLYILIRVMINRRFERGKPMLAPEPGRWSDASWKARGIGLAKVLPITILTLFILISIFAGALTPTESGAVSAVIAFVLALTLGRMRWAQIWLSIRQTIDITATILLIIIGTNALTYIFAITGIAKDTADAMTAVATSAGVAMIFIVILYLLLGTIIESTAMILITLPIVFPIVISYDLDPVWFGIVLTLLVEIALVTPPLGMNLFVIRGISGDSIATISRGVLPFLFILLGGIVLLWFAPQVAMWFPDLMKGR